MRMGGWVTQHFLQFEEAVLNPTSSVNANMPTSDKVVGFTPVQPWDPENCQFSQCFKVLVFTHLQEPQCHTHTFIHTHMSKNHWNRFFNTQIYRSIGEYGGVQHASTIDSPINACSMRGFRCCGGSTWDAWRMGTPTLDVRVPSAPDPGPLG